MPELIERLKEADLAYLGRCAEGTASPAEWAIYPEMRERLSAQSESLADVTPSPVKERDNDERFEGMSEAGKRGFFPEEGLVNAAEVLAFMGKTGLKKPCESLMKLVREGRAPEPFDWHSKPYRWLAEEVREWVSRVKPGSKERRSA